MNDGLWHFRRGHESASYAVVESEDSLEFPCQLLKPRCAQTRRGFFVVTQTDGVAPATRFMTRRPLPVRLKS
jgi:hypothetical protein